MKSFSTFITNSLIAFVILITAYPLIAQNLFIQHSIDNSFIGACSVCSYDLEGDGDLDILAAGSSGNYIAWWRAENDSFLRFTKFTIDTKFLK